MSLASVHLLFIALSTLLAIGAGAWGVRAFSETGSTWALVYGLLALAAVPLLLIYAVRVRRKLKALGGFSA